MPEGGCVVIGRFTRSARKMGSGRADDRHANPAPPQSPSAAVGAPGDRGGESAEA